MNPDGSLEILRIEPIGARTITYYDIGFARGGTPDPASGYRVVGASGVSRFLRELGLDESRRAVALDELARAGHVTLTGIRLSEQRRTELRL